MPTSKELQRNRNTLQIPPKKAHIYIGKPSRKNQLVELTGWALAPLSPIPGCCRLCRFVWVPCYSVHSFFCSFFAAFCVLCSPNHPLKAGGRVGELSSVLGQQKTLKKRGNTIHQTAVSQQHNEATALCCSPWHLVHFAVGIDGFWRLLRKARGEN